MPLNIDWQQILLHLFNFAILAGGLYLLLYKPVKKFMDDRTKQYEEKKREAEEQLSKAQSVKAEYDKLLSDAENEINEKRAAAARETDIAAEASLQNAKEQADEIIRHAKDEAKRERERIVSGAQADITKLAVAAAEKIIKSNSSDAIDRFISVTQKEENND